MRKHCHAESMALYAQDAAETSKPWERWEGRSHNGKWSPMVGWQNHPSWMPGLEYRRIKKEKQA